MTTIRAARPAEYEAIGELSARAYTESGNLSTDIDYTMVLRDAARQAEQAELLVAIEDDEVRGTVTLVRPGSAYADVARPGELEFRMLAVAPEAAGNGVGQALVEAVIDRARADGMERVVLCVRDSVEPAQRLYRRLGFERRPDRDWHPAPDVNLLGYALEL
ncbi:GNAT family N-acetyltransferase [Saccharopolyspora sp. NPDC050389]|uniref:GNAT family N-acetyltransferase n=1 Tax=Saccharopolyspora sp. NPDC050389 TaxID=3155516 RepID=UPI00340AA89F